MNAQPWNPPGQSGQAGPRPIYRCRVCAGRGHTFLEGAAGQPLQQVTCEFCHGSGTDTWVHDRGDERARRRERRLLWLRIGAPTYLVLLWATNGLNFWSIDGTGAPGWFGLHIVVWLVGICLAVKLWETSKARDRHQARKARNAEFSGPEEAILGAAFVAGSAINFKHNQDRRRQTVANAQLQATLNQILHNQQKGR
jgi:hypothetical protein